MSRVEQLRADLASFYRKGGRRTDYFGPIEAGEVETLLELMDAARKMYWVPIKDGPSAIVRGMERTGIWKALAKLYGDESWQKLNKEET